MLFFHDQKAVVAHDEDTPILFQQRQEAAQIAVGLTIDFQDIVLVGFCPDQSFRRVGARFGVMPEFMAHLVNIVNMAVDHFKARLLGAVAQRLALVFADLFPASRHKFQRTLRLL